MRRWPRPPEEGEALADGWADGEVHPASRGLSRPTLARRPRWDAATPAPRPYIDPHVGDLLVHHVRLDIPGHRSGKGHPLLLALSDGDEQGRREEDELEPLLGPVQEHGPGTERQDEREAG